MACKQFQFFECPDKEKCQVLIQVVQPDVCDCEGTFACCDDSMVTLEEKTADFKTEKHVPVVEKTPDGAKVVVGSTPHPMEADHWIQFIEVRTSDGQLLRQYLDPGDAPEAAFTFEGDIIATREHCNKHGLWMA
ncbi:MAG: desulfoferrodoxin family protein [Planctomycetota bacterium]|jgi:superoxide reductase